MFSYESDVVLDPFVGSGTTLVACKNNKRIGIGVELSNKYCNITISRLNSVQQTLFTISEWKIEKWEMEIWEFASKW